MDVRVNFVKFLVFRISRKGGFCGLVEIIVDKIIFLGNKKRYFVKV